MRLLLIIGFALLSMNVSPAEAKAVKGEGCRWAKARSRQLLQQFEQLRASRGLVNSTAEARAYSNKIDQLAIQHTAAVNYLLACRCSDTNGWDLVTRGLAKRNPEIPANCRL